MKTIRPQAITTHHLQRRTIVYSRSAVCSQASRDRQIAQRDVAIGWGWPIDAITIIDDDGVSDLDANRTGYQRLQRMIEDRQVGLVLVTDLARLSRSSAEIQHFLDLCRSTDTLVSANGTIVARDEHEQLTDQLRHCIAQFEKRRRARLRRSRQTPAANKAPKRIPHEASEEV